MQTQNEYMASTSSQERANRKGRGYAIVLTEEFARASAYDAANAQMRKACRKTWNVDDYNLACEKLARLMCYVNPQIGEALMRASGLS